MSTDDSPEQIPNITPNAPFSEMRPWEQRAAPGAGGAGYDGPVMSAPLNAPKVFAASSGAELATVIDNQVRMAEVQRLEAHRAATGQGEARVQSNEQAWKLFEAEELYDTKRVTLEHFHLFEWFPLSPGLFHKAGAAQLRREAYAELQEVGNHAYYHPRGKARMVRGGIGAVRILPVKLDSEPYVFMTASSNGVCHEGFPVLVPRHFYGTIKERIHHFGAAPATLSGEMRYVLDPEALKTFGDRRDLPQLYLHVDEIAFVAQPREAVGAFAVSVAASFFGTVDDERGTYLTFATFNPRDEQGDERVCQWIEEFYVEGLHDGVIVTDFDAVKVRFPKAVFGLSKILQGELDASQLQDLLLKLGLADPRRAEAVTTVINNHISVGTITNSTGVVVGGGQANVNLRPQP